LKTSLVLYLVPLFCVSCCSTTEEEGSASSVGGATELSVLGTWNIDLVRLKETWFEIGLKWERERAASRPGEPMTEVALRSRTEASTGELLAIWKGSTLIFSADGTCSFNQLPFKHGSSRSPDVTQVAEGEGGSTPLRYTSSGSTVTVVTDTEGAVIVLELEGDTLTGEMVPPPEARSEGKPAIPVVFQRG